MDLPLDGLDIAAAASSDDVVLASAIVDTDCGACLHDMRFMPKGVVCLVEGSSSRCDLNGSQCCLLEACPDGQQYARVSMLDTSDELEINRRNLRLMPPTLDASPTHSRHVSTWTDKLVPKSDPFKETGAINQRDMSPLPPLLLAALQFGGPTGASPPASAGSSEQGSDETGSWTCLVSESAEAQEASCAVAALPPPHGVRNAVSRAAGGVASIWRRRAPEPEQAESLRPPPATVPEQEALATVSKPEVDQHQDAKPSAWASHVQASSLDSRTFSHLDSPLTADDGGQRRRRRMRWPMQCRKLPLKPWTLTKAGMEVHVMLRCALRFHKGTEVLTEAFSSAHSDNVACSVPRRPALIAVAKPQPQRR